MSDLPSSGEASPPSRFATRAVRAASSLHGAERSLAPPLYLSTTFERDASGDYGGGFKYSRDDNPNRRALEAALTAIESGVEAAAFASGSAAAATLFQALDPGDHVVVADDCYYSIRLMVSDVFARWGLRVTFADCSDLRALQAAIGPATRLVFIETPSNPLMRITDVAGAASLAHGAGALLACDNTLATPALQRPLALGADIVLESTTKYLSGHHDAMGGALITARENAVWKSVRTLQRLCGAVPSPFASWLTLRGIASLTPRMRQHDVSALTVARFLAAHAAVRDVLHPGLASHPGHDLAASQMAGTGGLFSFRVHGGAEAALRVAARLRVFRRATSFGGPDSLVEHRASVEGPSSPTPGDLLRVAIGFEDPDDLCADLAQALSVSAAPE